MSWLLKQPGMHGMWPQCFAFKSGRCHAPFIFSTSRLALAQNYINENTRWKQISPIRAGCKLNRKISEKQKGGNAALSHARHLPSARKHLTPMRVGSLCFDAVKSPSGSWYPPGPNYHCYALTEPCVHWSAQYWQGIETDESAQRQTKIELLKG